MSTTIVDRNNRILNFIDDGLNDIVRLNDVDYDYWKDYIPREGTSIFREWAAIDGERLNLHTMDGGLEFMGTDDQNVGWTAPAYGRLIPNQIKNLNGTADMDKTLFHI